MSHDEMIRSKTARVESMARTIATLHGGAYVMKHPTEGMVTVAWCAGFRTPRRSLDDYTEANWPKYRQAADQVVSEIDDLVERNRACVRLVGVAIGIAGIFGVVGGVAIAVLS